MASPHLPVLIGGAYAFARYTGIERQTKDFDVFVRDEHFQPTLDALVRAGYATETTFPHWLGKAHHGEFFVDPSSARVHRPRRRRIPPCRSTSSRRRPAVSEEMIWSKGFIQSASASTAPISPTCSRRADDWAGSPLASLRRALAKRWRTWCLRLHPGEHDCVGLVMQSSCAARRRDERRAEQRPPASGRSCRPADTWSRRALGYRDGAASNPMTDADIAAGRRVIGDGSASGTSSPPKPSARVIIHAPNTAPRPLTNSVTPIGFQAQSSPTR